MAPLVCHLKDRPRNVRVQHAEVADEAEGPGIMARALIRRRVHQEEIHPRRTNDHELIVVEAPGRAQHAAAVLAP